MKSAKTYDAGGTSFTGVRIRCTPRELIAVAKKFDCEFYDGNTGHDKVNFDFTFATNECDIFTVYDWKKYVKLDLDKRIDFNIGAHKKSVAYEGKLQLFEEILKLR